MSANIVVYSIIHNDCPNCGAKAGTQCIDTKRPGITHGERLHAPRAEPHDKQAQKARTPYAPRYIGG